MTTLRHVLSASLATGATAFAAAQTPLSDMALYGVDLKTNELIRHQFGERDYERIGQVRLESGAILAPIESLAFIPGRPYLYGVWNSGDNLRSKLVKINMFNGVATPLDQETGFGNVEGLTYIHREEHPIDPGAATRVTIESDNDSDYEVSFIERTYNDDGTSTWTYRVRELGGYDLSHFGLELCDSHQVLESSPAKSQVVVDPLTGIRMVKWDLTDRFNEGEFSIRLDKHYAGSRGFDDITAIAKNSTSSARGSIYGPICAQIQEHELWAVHTDAYGRERLLLLDPTTGAARPMMNLSRRYEGLAANADGELYAVSDRYLFRLDVLNRREIYLGYQGYPHLEALEFAFGDSSPAVEVPDVPSSVTAGGALFGFTDDGDALLVLDPSNGSSFKLASAINYTGIEGLVFVTSQSDVPRTMLGAMYD